MRALCDRIWSDDYVPEVFDEWVRDRQGRCWVAVEDGTVVGIAKLTLSASDEAWLHGLRVDPRHRRRGIATALLDHRVSAPAGSVRGSRGSTRPRTTPR